MAMSGSELRRNPIPRTPVNKGMKEGRSAWPRPRCSPRRRTRRSDAEDLLLLGLELLSGEDALIPELGEPFELAHVLGFGRGRSWRRLGRLLLATEVLPHSHLALYERAAPLHARHRPVGLPCLHPARGPVRYQTHLSSPASPTFRPARASLRSGVRCLGLQFLDSLGHRDELYSDLGYGLGRQEAFPEW